MRKYEFHRFFLFYYAVVFPSATKSKNLSFFQTENPVDAWERNNTFLYSTADGNTLFMRFIGNSPLLWYLGSKLWIVCHNKLRSVRIIISYRWKDTISRWIVSSAQLLPLFRFNHQRSIHRRGDYWPWQRVLPIFQSFQFVWIKPSSYPKMLDNWN